MGSGDDIDLQPERRIDSIAAAARLASSKRFRNVLIIAGGLLWSAFMGASGWIGGKLEIRLELEQLEKQAKVLTGELLVLRSQHEDLDKQFKALISTATEPPGRLVLIDRELDYLRLDLVRATAATYAGESPSTRKHKAAAANGFGASYKRLREQGNTRSAAAETLFREVAVP